MHLNLEPVAKEGFVFVVSKDNPVESLTQQQIRDIYSGKITNWSEVGGNDEEIIPYQRNNDSGSQNYMNEFMKASGLIIRADNTKNSIIRPQNGLLVLFFTEKTVTRGIGFQKNRDN